MEYEEKIGEKSKDKALQTTLLLSQQTFPYIAPGPIEDTIDPSTVTLAFFTR